MTERNNEKKNFTITYKRQEILESSDSSHPEIPEHIDYDVDNTS